MKLLDSAARDGIALCTLALVLTLLPAQASGQRVWELAGPTTIVLEVGDDVRVPATVFGFDAGALGQLLQSAPLQEFGMERGVLLELPDPDGQLHPFRVVETTTLGPGMRASRPDIRTYAGVAGDGTAKTLRMTIWAGGMSMVIDGPDGWVVEGTGSDRLGEARVWHQEDGFDAAGGLCQVEDVAGRFEEEQPVDLMMTRGDELRTLRIAISGSGEFTVHHGSVAAAEAAIVQLVNVVNAILERDLALRMLLVDANVYPDPETDPFTNATATSSLLLSENHDALVEKLGTSAFDLGHVVSDRSGSGWSGLANVNVQCSPWYMGGGSTIAGSPSALQLRPGVLHEVGHQLGARHSFNGSTDGCGPNRTAGWAYEIASGVSIMSYAGVCGSENVVGNSLLMYNAGAMQQIQLALDAASPCAGIELSGNLPPVADAGGDYSIPLETAFVLDGSGSSDPDGGTLTYSWEQFDLGPASPPYGPLAGPLFRNYLPTFDSDRALPEYSAYRFSIPVPYEFLPTVDRSVNFRLVVRDNFAGSGGTAWDAVSLTAAGAPFRVTSPNGGESTPAGDPADVTWQVGGGAVAADVRILFSADAGVSWTVVEPGTPNDGFHTVSIPCAETTEGRIRVEPLDNIFYDISDADFIVTPDATGPVVTCPQPVTFGATSPDGISTSDQEFQDWASGATVLDNCDPDPSLTPAAPPTLPVGTTLVTFFSVDASNNVGTCGVNVTVEPYTATGAVPGRTALLGAHPNPFNPRTTITYSLGESGNADLIVYDLTGRRVKMLVSGYVDAGRHVVPWDGRDDHGRRVASGVYLYRLVAGEFSETKRMVLLK